VLLVVRVDHPGARERVADVVAGRLVEVAGNDRSRRAIPERREDRARVVVTLRLVEARVDADEGDVPAPMT
jgi:hypothetical protein